MSQFETGFEILGIIVASVFVAIVACTLVYLFECVCAPCKLINWTYNKMRYSDGDMRFDSV